jgi:LacI family transcriptional regulator
MLILQLLENYVERLMDKINIKLLAKELNLAPSTVSRALRDSYEISPETKERVLELARKLNYQPNPYASSLRKQKSNTIAVIIPEIANNFFTLAINGIEEVAQQYGYHVLIYLTHEDFKKEISIANHMGYGRVDGVLISISSGTNNFSHLDELYKRKIPIVFFDRVYDKMNAPRITTNDYESSYKGTLHLIEKGCRKIAFLQVSDTLSIGTKRLNGYLDALKEKSLPVEEKWIIKSGTSTEDYSRIKEILSASNRPDAIFASVEKMAITSYHVCRDLKLNIPSDIKIIGFSNLETATLLHPSLTTITQPAFEMGKEAATILFKGLNKNISDLGNKNTIIESVLIEREST